MTETTGSDVVAYEEYGDVGLEDIGVSDIIIPRLQIVHQEGLFKDNLSGATFNQMDVILLGLVKQRIMWAEDPEDKDKPLCKSPDFIHGFPNLDDKLARDKRFPWNVSNFEPEQAKPIEISPNVDHSFPQGYSSNGLPVLNCSVCKFNKWGTNPANGKSTPPPCTEQHTYALQYSPDDGENWITALLTLQRTGIKPSKQYISSFAQTKTPMFTVRTTLGLSLQKKGTVDYSVPTFRRGDPTDRNTWMECGNQLRSIRDFIRSAPRRTDEDEDAPVVISSNENTAPVAPPVAKVDPMTAPPSQPAPVAAPAPAIVPSEDDQLPF